MRAHFFDLDVLVSTEAKVWIVDKSKPNIPIFKIKQSDFNLIKSGVFKSQNNLVASSGQDFWFPTKLFNLLKIKFKSYKSDFSNLMFSLQEFMNSDLIENLDYKILSKNFAHLKNSDDHIYVICSKNSKKNYKSLIDKLEVKLKENGLLVKKYYYISETFFNRDEPEISHKKARLLIQHSLGFKTDVDRFTDEQIDSYSEVYFYDDNRKSIEVTKDCNSVYKFLISNTEQEVSKKIKNQLKESEHIINVILVTHNDLNRFIVSKVIIDESNLIKTFEKFNYKF